MKKILSILGLALAMAGLQATFAMPSHADTLAALFGNNLQVVAAAGKVNNITISTDAAGNVLVSDTGDVVRVDAGLCAQVTAHQVRCQGVLVIGIFAGDLDDTITNTSAVSTHQSGGPGRDTLRGGPGGDGLAGGPGDDVAFGNSGNDSFQADGIDGRDSFSGGPGSDTAAYNNRGAAQTITLDGVANDGTAGEGDNLGSDVENVLGGAGADRITGNGAANEIRGGSGDDVINTVDGIGGNDTLSAAGGTDTCNSDAGDIELTCEI
jgi:Ca2+-binding RTX toxin-like protein